MMDIVKSSQDILMCFSSGHDVALIDRIDWILFALVLL